jgi:methylisocitrate lyase
MLIERHGFEGVYVSGAVLAASLGLPDVGLTTADEMTGFAGAIAGMTSLPTFADADTGFGERINVARTVQGLESAGLVGCHIEDQVLPKRCGHLNGKRLVHTQVMVGKIQAAVAARRDPNFCICARTDARAVEGLAASIDRARAYVDAGADMIFPEALQSEEEFEVFRASVHIPLLANMTEFGKSPILTTSRLEELGYNVAIYPVTLLRTAMAAVNRSLLTIRADGSQRSLISEMQTRAELYELIDYSAYEEFEGTSHD